MGRITLSQFKIIKITIIANFTVFDFDSGMRETERDLIFIGIRQLDVLTFYPRSHDLSVSRDKVSIHETFDIRFLSIFNYDSTCDLTDVAA